MTIQGKLSLFAIRKLNCHLPLLVHVFSMLLTVTHWGCLGFEQQTSKIKEMDLRARGYVSH